MSKLLTGEQISRYRADGYLFPCQGLDGEAVARARADLAAAEAALGGPLMAAPAKYRHNLHLLCPWMDTLVRSAPIVDAVEDLLGPDILLYTSRFFIKDAGTPAIAAWHQDSTYFGLRPFEHVTAWLALSDVPLASGPVEFATGSHIRGQLHQQSKMVADSVNTAGQIIVEWFDQAHTASAVLEAGQFSLHHTCVVHQSGPNRAGHQRIGLALSYIPTRVHSTGGVRMGATLIRGQDHHGHFELSRPPQTAFGGPEQARHDAAFSGYLQNFHEQLARHEQQLPAA